MRENPITYEQMLAKISSKVGGSYVFASLAEPPPDVKPMVLIREQEGITVALSLEDIQKVGLGLQEFHTIITLSVPGSLDVVGLSSGIFQILSTHSIPSNIFSGIYHTYIFVPSDRVEGAKVLLDDISGRARAWANHWIPEISIQKEMSAGTYECTRPW